MNMQTSSAEKLARKFRFDIGYSFTEPISVYNVVKSLDILTIFLPMSLEVCGLSILSDKHKFILVNSNIVLGRQHFTIAHELYHLFFDENPTPHLCSSNGKTKAEKAADAFASALLMPLDGILKVLPSNAVKEKNVTLTQVINMEQYFGVSRQSILYRLKNLDLITQSKLDSFLLVPVKESARRYGYTTALYAPGNHNLIIGDYVESAVYLFENDIISEGHRDEILKELEDGQN